MLKQIAKAVVDENGERKTVVAWEDRGSSRTRRHLRRAVGAKPEGAKFKRTLSTNGVVLYARHCDWEPGRPFLPAYLEVVPSKPLAKPKRPLSSQPKQTYFDFRGHHLDYCAGQGELVVYCKRNPSVRTRYSERERELIERDDRDVQCLACHKSFPLGM